MVAYTKYTTTHKGAFMGASGITYNLEGTGEFITLQGAIDDRNFAKDSKFTKVGSIDAPAGKSHDGGCTGCGGAKKPSPAPKVPEKADEGVLQADGAYKHEPTPADKKGIFGGKKKDKKGDK